MLSWLERFLAVPEHAQSSLNMPKICLFPYYIGTDAVCGRVSAEVQLTELSGELVDKLSECSAWEDFFF